MFSSKSRSEIEINPSSSSTSLIGAGTIIKGDIISSGDIRIDGTLKGNITGSAKVLIGAEGLIEGDVEGQQADILGKVTGKIVIKDLLNLRGKATIKGNISAGKLQVEPTVTFKGQCHVGEGTVAEVVEMKEDQQPIAKAK
ncbi:MAG: polymer-forming cytoskeletal protein [Chitinophagaceae bacterium]|nr:polymer-forming cytoskeletal protein [Chitinophagaceae bacterium]